MCWRRDAHGSKNPYKAKCALRTNVGCSPLSRLCSRHAIHHHYAWLIWHPAE